jgi:hypothetical protein
MLLYRSHPVRDAYRDWLVAVDFELAVTINANIPLSEDRCRQILRAIDGKVNRLFLGPRYSRRPEHQRVCFVGVPERKASGVHFHIALKIPVSMSLRLKRWFLNRALNVFLRSERNGRRFLPSASIHVQPCDTGWIDYIVKNVWADTQVYLSGVRPISEASPTRLSNG